MQNKMSDEVKQNSSPQPVWPPVRQDYRVRSRFPTAVTILLSGLALLLIVSGLAFVVYSTTIQYHRAFYTQATVYIQLTRHAVGTTQAYANATAQALSTVQADIDATAASQANATATIDNATATATSLSDLYTQSTGGTSVLNDPLSDNTGDGKWDVGSSATNTGCTFTDNAYHVQEARKGLLLPCIAEATRFSNFAYQVDMTIAKGNGGQAGLIFRIDNTNKAYYFFHIGTDGSYAFDVYQSNGQVSTLTKGFHGAITIGLGQSNQIAVVARSNTVYLFVNGQYIDAITDTTFTLGKVGVAVVNTSVPIDVQFSDAQVWNLSAS